MVRLVSHRTTICAGLAKATGVSWAFADRLPLCTLPFSGFFGREATGSDFSDGVSDPVWAIVHFYCPQRTLALKMSTSSQSRPAPGGGRPLVPQRATILADPANGKWFVMYLDLQGAVLELGNPEGDDTWEAVEDDNGMVFLATGDRSAWLSDIMRHTVFVTPDGKKYLKDSESSASEPFQEFMDARAERVVDVINPSRDSGVSHLDVAVFRQQCHGWSCWFSIPKLYSEA